MGGRGKPKLAATVLAGVIFAAALAGAYAWRQQGPQPLRRVERTAPKEQAPGAAGPLTSDVRLVERLVYPECDAVLETERPPGQGEVGRRLEDLLRGGPWRLVGRQGGRIVMERRLPGPCPPPEWLQYRTVGLYQDRVAIFYGRSVEGRLRHVTDIEARRLLPGDRRRLATGLVVSSEREAWQLIESLMP